MFVYNLESETVGHMDFAITSRISPGDKSNGCPSWIDDMQARCVMVHPFEGESYVPSEEEAREIDEWFAGWLETAEGRGVRERIEDIVWEGVA